MGKKSPSFFFKYTLTLDVSQGFTRRIVGVPKAESDAILTFLFSQISENPDHQVRFRWGVNSIAFWDNRVSQSFFFFSCFLSFFVKQTMTVFFFFQIVTHSATFDFWPAMRHALRATPHGEKPTSVEDYEHQTGKEAKDRQLEIWKQQGITVDPNVKSKSGKARGYND